MLKTFKYGVAAVATVAASTLFAGAAMAADAEISGNGSGSVNSVTATQTSTEQVGQSNSSVVVTQVSSKASTGGNTANKNTGGDVLVVSGDAASAVDVIVEGGSNNAGVLPCGCPDDASNSAHISGNGSGSVNLISWLKLKTSSLTQLNTQVVTTGVLNKAKTGKNKANLNTGGSTTVMSGSSTTGTGVFVGGSSNTVNP